MKKYNLILMVCCMFFISTQANAGPSYVGVNYLLVDFDNKQLAASFDLDAVTVNFGKYFHENFAIEGRLGAGWSYDTYSAAGTKLDYRINLLSGVYLRGELPLGKFRPYVMGGINYVQIRVRGTLLTFPVNGYESERDFSYGAGLDFQLTDSFGVNGEYLKMIRSSRRDVDSLSAGVKFYF